MAASSFGICRTCCMLWLAAMDRNSPWPSIILQYCERWQIEGNDFLVYVTGCCGQLDAACCVLTVQMARDQSRRTFTLSSALLVLPACGSSTDSARPPATTRPWLISAQLVTRLCYAGHCFHEGVASLRSLPLHFSPILHFSSYHLPIAKLAHPGWPQRSLLAIGVRTPPSCRGTPWPSQHSLHQ